MKLKHIAAVTTLAVLLPLAASALSIDDIQQQIAKLLSQIAQLQEQLKLLQTTPPELPPPVRICPQILRQLSQGVSGDDVMGLQAYLGVSQTGYFGPVTASAVAQFQSSEGLNQVGIVGPMTRAAFARKCGGGGGSQNFSASPTSGAAPLDVHFSSSLAVPAYSTYTLNYGDGMSETISTACPTLVAGGTYTTCGLQSMNHTYTSSGTYTATLSKQGSSCETCMDIRMTVIGTLTINVGGTTSGGAPSISGLDAPTSLSVGQSGTWTVHASAPAGTQLRYSVTWGDEVWPQNALSSAQASVAPLQANATFTHTYQSAGKFTPTFTVGNDSGSAKTSASVTVGGSPQICPMILRTACPAGQHYEFGPTTYNSMGCSVQDAKCVPDTNLTFSASRSSGSAPLAVRFTSNVGGTVEFGDGSSVQMFDMTSIMQCDGPCSPSWSSSHTYTSAGTYTAELTKIVPVQCPYGAPCLPEQVQSLGTVTIIVTGSNTACTTEYMPVCGQTPDLCFYADPPPSYCSGLGWHQQKTYSNRCGLDAAHATFLHAGVCN